MAQHFTADSKALLDPWRERGMLRAGGGWIQRRPLRGCLHDPGAARIPAFPDQVQNNEMIYAGIRGFCNFTNQCWTDRSDRGANPTGMVKALGKTHRKSTIPQAFIYGSMEPRNCNVPPMELQRSKGGDTQRTKQSPTDAQSCRQSQLL